MTNALYINSLNKNIKERKILECINLQVKKGDIYALLGINGAGKTTLMKSIFGIVKPDSGNIEILDKKIDPNQENDVFSKVGSIIETPVFYERKTAEENLNIQCDYLGEEHRKNIKKTLEDVGLHNAENKKVYEFSLGMKQRLGLARALVNDPELLILDEPINGLDPIGISDVREILIKRNEDNHTTILLSSHIIGEVAKIAHSIGIIHDGRIIKETLLSQGKVDNEYLEDFFKEQIRRNS